MIDYRYKAKNWIRISIAALIGVLLLGTCIYYWMGGFEPKFPNREKMPAWFPIGENLEKCAWGDLLGNDVDLIVVPYGIEWAGRIEYEEMLSVNADYDGSGAVMSFKEPDSFDIEGGKYSEFDPKYFERYNKAVIPAACFSPSFDKKYYHKKLTASVSMDVDYSLFEKDGEPDMSPNGGLLEEKSKRLKRDVSFFVVSPEEMSEVKKFLKPSLADDGKGMKRYIIIFVTSLGGCFIFYALAFSIKGIYLMIKYNVENADMYLRDYIKMHLRRLLKKDNSE